MTTILVIEDVQSLRETILEMLDLMDFQSLGAKTGAIGIQMAQQHLPDLIICDIMMPEMDGYAVLKMLRQDPETAQIPFIFLSAKADRSDIRQGMNLGADDYLTKPFTSEELQAAITARLEKQAAIVQPYITEMKRATEQLGQMAYRDPLTGLPNRILFQHRLQDALLQAKRHQESVAILCVNLDGFHSINADLGQMAGDLLLQSVAKRLTTCVALEDTVARLSGDEFSILLTQVGDGEKTQQTLQKILQVLTTPYSLYEKVVNIQVSLGVTVFPEDNSTADGLLNHAIMAMKWGRQHGRSGYQLYNSEIETSATARQVLKDHLETALEQSEFQVYYQPQVNLVTGRITGAEALMRWQHPQMGFVSPAIFIPIAEETGLIVPLGEWLLRTVCAQAKIWQSTQLFPIRISVNLSAIQLKHPNLVETIAQILTETELSNDFLGLELTETAAMENVEAAIAALHQIRNLGLHLAIDDFGTGYSSLSQLRRLPIDTLKIDRSFVQNVPNDPNDTAIASAIIALARSLDLRVIAEGIETQEQCNFLRRQGCHAMQGFLFSPAVPAPEFEQFLVEDQRLSFSELESSPSRAS